MIGSSSPEDCHYYEPDIEDFDECPTTICHGTSVRAALYCTDCHHYQRMKERQGHIILELDGRPVGQMFHCRCIAVPLKPDDKITSMHISNQAIINAFSLIDLGV